MRLTLLSTVICVIVSTVACGPIEDSTPSDGSTEPDTPTPTASADDSLDCQLIEGDVSIGAAADLARFEPPPSAQFDFCIDVTGSLLIEDTADIVDLNELRAVRQIGGWLAITDNAALQSTAALRSITSVGEGVRVEGNPQLDALNLSSVARLGGDFHVSRNRSLEKLAISGDLRSVAGEFVVVGNDALLELRAVALETVGETFVVENNDRLQAIGFDALSSVGGSLVVVDNSVLPTCQVLELVDAVGPADIGLSIKISGNDDTTSCP